MEKVLIVVCQMNRGGLESRLMEIIRNMDISQIGIDIFTYRMEKGYFDDEIKQYGGKVYYNPPLTPLNMFWYVKYFRNFLLAHKEYKIVHAQTNAWCSVFCKGAYLAGVSVRIAHSMTALSGNSLVNISKNIIKIPTSKYATHYFAVSELAGKWLFGEKNIKEGKVQIWKNAIDCKAFQFNAEVRETIRKELGLESKRIIMHVGNFTPPKNQRFLPKVLYELIKKNTEYFLIMVGGETHSGLQGKVMNEVNEMGIRESVLFMGARSDIDKLLQAADIFCFPSLYEGLPGAVLEAQAAGLPCIISDTITNEVKILDTTKMLSLQSGADAWARAIIETTNIERKDTYEDMVHAGFDIKNLIKDLEGFYKTVGRY